VQERVGASTTHYQTAAARVLAAAARAAVVEVEETQCVVLRR
tara:strand:+ start:317 stop:442 length:126 start_codon:yes stop_codon:yes gene_type:complete